MRYVIIGAGGVGSGIAGYLNLAGIEVAMVARPDHAEAVNEDGLTLVTDSGSSVTAYPRAVSSIENVDWEAIDVALLTVKSYDTASIAQSLIRLGRSLPPIICVQNGVDNEPTIARFGLTPIAAVPRFKARLLSPGKIFVPGERSVTIGSWGEIDLGGLLPDVCDDIRSSGITCEISKEIMSVKWSKLIANCANVIYAITGSQVRDIQRDPHLVRSINLVWAEAHAVLRCAGMDFAALPDLEPPTKHDASTSDQDSTGGLEYHGSTWDDVHRQKARNEVPWFNGEVVRVARQHGLDAPLNSYLVAASGALAKDRHRDLPKSTKELESRLVALGT